MGGPEQEARLEQAESIPPQSTASDGPETPLDLGEADWKNTLLGAELNAESERQAAAQAGHPGAQASARQVETGQREAR